MNDSNRRDGGDKNNGATMVTSVPKVLALSVLAACAVALAGCSDTLSNAETNQTFQNSLKSYDKTMTPEQRQAAISDLQKEQAARQTAAQGGAAAPVAPAQN